MFVTVGSQSSYKIDAVADAAALVFSQREVPVTVNGISCQSGVSDQPMSNLESILGARTRAAAAINAPGSSLGVGIENGLDLIDGIWFATTWIVARTAAGCEGIASTVHRPVPTEIMTQVLAGHELSHAVEIAIPASIRAQYHGLIGIITQGRLNRHDILRDGIVVAMSHCISQVD